MNSQGNHWKRKWINVKRRIFISNVIMSGKTRRWMWGENLKGWSHLPVCVSMCVSVCVSLCLTVCVYMCLCVCYAHLCVFVSLCVCVSLCVYVHIHICIYVFVSVYLPWVSACMCMFVCFFKGARIRTKKKQYSCTHTDIHTHTQFCQKHLQEKGFHLTHGMRIWPVIWMGRQGRTSLFTVTVGAWDSLAICGQIWYQRADRKQCQPLNLKSYSTTSSWLHLLRGPNLPKQHHQPGTTCAHSRAYGGCSTFKPQLPLSYFPIYLWENGWTQATVSVFQEESCEPQCSQVQTLGKIPFPVICTEKTTLLSRYRVA